MKLVPCRECGTGTALFIVAASGTYPLCVECARERGYFHPKASAASPSAEHRRAGGRPTEPAAEPCPYDRKAR